MLLASENSLFIAKIGFPTFRQNHACSGCQQTFFVGLRSRKFSYHSPFPHHDRSVAHPKDFGQFG